MHCLEGCKGFLELRGFGMGRGKAVRLCRSWNGCPERRGPFYRMGARFDRRAEGTRRRQGWSGEGIVPGAERRWEGVYPEVTGLEWVSTSEVRGEGKGHTGLNMERETGLNK